MASTKSTSKAPAKKPAAKPVAKAETKAEATAPASTPAQKPIHVETPSGFQVDIRPELWDDMELLELMAKASSEDDVEVGLALPALVNKIFTPDQKKALYDHLRTPDGRVPLSKVSQEIGAIINGLGGASKK